MNLLFAAHSAVIRTEDPFLSAFQDPINQSRSFNNASVDWVDSIGVIGVSVACEISQVPS